jgi:hypothetical protein
MTNPAGLFQTNQQQQGQIVAQQGGQIGQAPQPQAGGQPLVAGDEMAEEGRQTLTQQSVPITTPMPPLPT